MKFWHSDITECRLAGNQQRPLPPSISDLLDLPNNLVLFAHTDKGQWRGSYFFMLSSQMAKSLGGL